MRLHIKCDYELLTVKGFRSKYMSRTRVSQCYVPTSSYNHRFLYTCEQYDNCKDLYGYMNYFCITTFKDNSNFAFKQEESKKDRQHFAIARSEKSCRS